MADPVSATLLSVAATGLSAGGSIMQGMRGSQGAQMEAKNAANAAEIGKIKAEQTTGDMTRRLTSQLANIEAVRAGAGLDPNSPTGRAISAQVGGVGDLNRTAAMTTISAQISADQNAEKFYTQSASDALLGGFMGAAGSVLKGIGGASGTG